MVGSSPPAPSWRSVSPRAAAATAAPAAAADVSGEIAGAGSSAQEAAQEAWIAEFENENSGVDDLLRPGWLRRRPRTVHRRRQLPTRGSDARSRRRRRRAEKGGQALRTGRTDRDPGLRLADRDRLQPAEASKNCSSTRKPLAKIFNQEITTWNDPAIAKPTTRASNCPTPGSPRSTAPTSPARRRTSPTTSRRPRPASGPTK